MVFMPFTSRTHPLRPTSSHAARRRPAQPLGPDGAHPSALRTTVVRTGHTGAPFEQASGASECPTARPGRGQTEGPAPPGPGLVVVPGRAGCSVLREHPHVDLSGDVLVQPHLLSLIHI